MGLLKKVFASKEATKIGITVDKPYYSSEEVVTGRFFFTVKTPTECDAIVLRFSGFADASWSDHNFGTPGDTSRFHKEFFKENIANMGVSQIIAPGHYIYPFSYKLPSGLPGSFAFVGNEEYELNRLGDLDAVKDARGVDAHIYYLLKATLQTKGIFIKDSEAAITVNLYDRMQPMVHTGTSFDLVHTMRCSWLIPKGKCKLHVITDKTAYTYGERPEVALTVQNQSPVAIRCVRVSLIRMIHLECGIMKKIVTTTESFHEFSGVDALSDAVYHFSDTPLAGATICPTIEGYHISCTYHFEVTCNISWCSKISLKLPIVIAPPTNIENALPVSLPIAEYVAAEETTLA